MKVWKLLQITAISTCLIARIADYVFCEPVPLGGYNIRNLFAESDLVIIGSAEKTQVIRKWTKPAAGNLSLISREMQTMSTVVRVERTYKGICGDIVDVQFDIPVAFIENPGPVLYKGERSLLFLKAGPDGTYYFADRLWGKFDAEGLSVIAGGSGESSLERDLNRSMSGTKAGQISALDILLGFAGVSRSTELSLNRVAGQSDPDVAAKALSVLLASGQPKYFLSALQFLRKYPHSITPADLMALSGRIREFGSHADPLTMAALSNVSVSAVQYAALDVLAEMRSPATVEAMIHHLDDPNPEIQYESLYVLRDIVDGSGEKRGKEFSPSFPEFKSNPKYYTDLWKTWWDSEGNARYPRGTLGRP